MLKLTPSVALFSARNIKLCWLLISVPVLPVLADDYFDPSALEHIGGNGVTVDLTALEKPGGQLPGIYLVSVYLNNNYKTEIKVNFRLENDKLIPDLTKAQLLNWGVNGNATSRFMLLKDGLLPASLASYLPDSDINFDGANQRLSINVPQIYMRPSIQNNVPPSEWDDGINAAFINYNYSGSSSKTVGEKGTNITNYINLRSGINIGPWRLRNYSTWSASASDSHWNIINSYLQRGITPLRSQLIAGESTTQGDIFDAFAFRGIQLASDDSMQPDSLRGFAPIVRGIAKSNAQVTITQYGNTIYQSYIPAGPFAITDIYPTSASGDLEVTIKEADGSVRKFTQPFASVPIMQREGRFKYAVTAGQYRDSGQAKMGNGAPLFSQLTGIYGLTSATTVYGGTLLSRHYIAENIGIGKGLGDIGSISLDATWAKAEFNQLQSEGASIRFQYSKNFVSTGTNFTLAGYRYSTSGYLDFSEANGFQQSEMTKQNNSNRESDAKASFDLTQWRYQHNRRSRAQLTFNQNFANYGGVNISGYQQQYWGISEPETSISIGYYLNLKNINYSLNYSLTQSPYSKVLDKAISLAVQIPFDRFMPSSWLSVSNSKTEHGNSNSTISISGSALDDSKLSYSLQQGMADNRNSMSTTASADYKAQLGEFNVGANYAGDNRVLNYGAMGGIVFHRYGITLSQSLGDTVALVRAVNASGVKVINNSGVSTDGRGYAVVPYLSPYQHNEIQLDTGTLDENSDIDKDSLQVTPSEGAIVMANFPTHSGGKIMLILQSSTSIPMGATASLQNGVHTAEGMVDDRGQVYLSGAPQKGVVDVTWQGGHCKAHYDIGTDKNSIHLINAQCI